MSSGLHGGALFDLPLFAGLSALELAGLEGHLVTERHARGALVFRQGDHGDALYVVMGGQVALEHHAGDRTDLLALCGPGDWFGELALLTGGPRTADARVTLDATLVGVSRAAWTVLSLRAPQLFARLCERLSLQLRATNEPARPARRAVIACGDSVCGAPPWLEDLERSIRRQFPGRDVHILGRAPGTGRAALEWALADIVTPDVVVLIAGDRASGLADRQLHRRADAEWVLDAYDGTAPTIVRGASPAAALDRVARLLAGGTIGLALGAGGAYGYAHIGLLRVLEDAGLPVDVVAGTSMGAIVGAALAAGVSARRLTTFAESLAARYRSVALRDLSLRGPGLLRGTGVLRVLAELEELASATFETLALPFAAIAMDVRTGEEVVLDTGPILEGIRPSFAMPGIFPACPVGDRLLVDGAMVNPVPVTLARALGADFVIAVQPIPPLDPGVTDPVQSLLGRARWVVDLLPILRLRGGIEALDVSVRSFQSLWFHLALGSAVAADALVRPDLAEFWFLQFGEATSIIGAGEGAARAALPRIRDALAERLGLAIGQP